MHPGTIPLDGRGRIVVRRSAYPTSLILLAGPTGVGKSAVALALAERLDGEIISVDSMQVYRGLDIGTAKPTAQERQRVPHHLIDVVEVNQSFDAAQFMRLARAVAADIRGRGRLPILCGGTGLYFMAFLEGFGEAPPANATLRADLEATPLPGLLRELEQRDPVIFARIDRNNPRRVMRAVEVIRLTGRPFSAQRISWNRKGGAARTEQGTGERELFFGLARSKPDLHARIDSRVDEMFARGLVRETEQLLQRGLAENRTAMQAIGYRQVVELLRGERSLADTVALVKQRTRQLAKRQMTWFRGQFDIEWTELEPETGPDEIAERLLKHQEEDPTV